MSRQFLRTAASRIATAVGAAVIAAVVVAGSLSIAQAATEAVANNSVTSAKIRNNAVRGIDIRNNSVTGADINESTLAVPEVNGMTIVPINHRSDDVAATPFATLNGVTFRVACSGGAESITVTTTDTGDNDLSSISTLADTTTPDFRGANFDAFDAGDTPFNVGPAGGGAEDRVYDIVYSAADGGNVVAHLSTEATVGVSTCVVSGYIIG